MKLHYVSHASLMLETEHSLIVTDPWFNGPAYGNQWHVFPRPVNTSFTQKATHVVLTHGHEDHLHFPTLNLFNRDATVYFPYMWKGDTVKAIKDLGFQSVVESVSYKSYSLDADTTVTYLANGLDAIAVFEYKGKVYVDLNDALNAHHKYFIRLFTSEIKKRWGQIDVLICGLGGAGYFPNAIHSPGKNDQEIGDLREQFLAHKFCEVVAELQPKSVFSFVPGFALLAEDKQWINRTRFPRYELPEYYRSNFDPNSTIRFMPLMPGDYIEDGEWVMASPYHKQAVDDALSHLIPQVYHNEMEDYNRQEYVSKDVVPLLVSKLRDILPISSAVYNNDLLRNVNFSIRLTDVRSEWYIRCHWGAGTLLVTVEDELKKDSDLLITTTSKLLQYALDNEWGGDVFFIGYGADIHVLNADCLQENMDIVSLRLLSRFPSASYYMVRSPLRAAKYLVTNPRLSWLAAKQKMMTNGNPNKLPYNERSHWVNKSKCEVCQICDIPLLTDAFAHELEKAG